MKIGNLQRRWAQEKPATYDKATRIVCLDIKEEKQTVSDGDTETGTDGYSYIPVEIDAQFDYGHVKSQLIEAGFAQKDEFGLLMNAVEAIINGDTDDNEDVEAFKDFCSFRKMCAEAAHTVMEAYK